MLFKNTLPALAGLVALSQAVAIEPVLDERQLICPAGYGPMGSAVVTTNIVITPVVINQFFGSNTVINIFGNTFNINNAPTSVSTTVTVTSTVTSTVTAGAAVATPFILGISAAGAVKRQTGPSYIGGGGSSTSDCGSAQVWGLVNGQLNSGGLLVSTSAGTSFQPFSVSSSVGSISSTWSSTGNGIEWTNSAFQGGVAGFYSLNGVVEIVFNGSAPAGATPVVLSVIPANACPALSSSSVPPTTTPTTTPSSSVTTPTASPSVTGAFNLQVNIPQPQRKAKRQGSTFIGAGGVITTDATQAQSFFISNNGLFSGAGQFSTNAGVTSEPFNPISPVGSITGLFAANGPLSWTNSAFANGAASFCLLGQTIQFVFSAQPAGCITVSLTPIPAGSAATSSSSSVAPPTTSPPPFSSTPLPSSSSTFGPFTTSNTTSILPTGGLRRRY